MPVGLTGQRDDQADPAPSPQSGVCLPSVNATVPTRRHSFIGMVSPIDYELAYEADPDTEVA